MEKNAYFRKLPKVDVLLKEEAVQQLCEEYGRGLVVECIRQELDRIRMSIFDEKKEEIENALEQFMENLVKKIEDTLTGSLKKVRNATGIILHTNLGRAPLGKVQMDAVMQAMSGYSNLEYNLEAGNRGKRWTHYAELASKVTGAESAVAVNNNAASLTLIFSALAKGKEVLVSRGESIEIGGHFRIPEVIEQSGAVLREVGTTNRTRICDYEKAITENTGALFKVHTSNYKIVGFTEEASLEELVALGEKYQLPVIMDLGSGVLVNLEKYGLAHEPTVQEMTKTGADIVCFSGDKLLGGPQAGIIVGKEKWIRELEHHPLMRAIRLDKCAIAALEATFREYLDENQAMKNIPVMRMIARTEEELKAQAELVCAELAGSKEQNSVSEQAVTAAENAGEKDFSSVAEFAVEPSISMVGGGSLPGETMASYAVTMVPRKMSCEEMSAEMRKLPVPIISHVKNDKIWLDMRTIMPEDVDEFVKEVRTYCKK